MRVPDGTTRLLPWTTPEGKPCYLVTDEGGGFMSRLADDAECRQLAVGTEVLEHAQALLAESGTPVDEFRFLSAGLTGALRDVLRIAESRGARLPASGGDAET